MNSLQESRLFKILYYLLDKGRATAPELAEKFEVSVRTIYRDVDAISSAGIPIYITTGRNGGIQLLDTFVLDKTLFSEKEKHEILSTLQGLSATQYPDIEVILNKLGAAFQLRLTDWIAVDFSRWGSDADNENLLFRKLKQAIFEKRQIRFTYFNSSGAIGTREVQPQKLAYKDNAWYLYGFCLLRNDYRLFRITRIKDLVLTEAHFETLPKTNGDIFPHPQELGALIDLKLDFAPDAGYRLFDTFDDKAISQHENGYRVAITLPENDWLYDFLLSFGDKVTIVAPDALRETISNKCEAAFNHHKGV